MAKENLYYVQSVLHVGRVLEEKLGEMHVGLKEFAVGASMPEKSITAILRGDSSITPNMAVLCSLKVISNLLLDSDSN